MRYRPLDNGLACQCNIWIGPGIKQQCSGYNSSTAKGSTAGEADKSHAIDTWQFQYVVNGHASRSIYLDTRHTDGITTEGISITGFYNVEYSTDIDINDYSVIADTATAVDGSYIGCSTGIMVIAACLYVTGQHGCSAVKRKREKQRQAGECFTVIG